MTSKHIFNHSAVAALALATCGLIASGTTARGDSVELNNGDVLTGTIQSLEQGLVILRSPLAYAPLEIKSSAIRKLSFPGQAENNPIHQERLTLANGDVIPCKVLSMNEKQLHISTWFAGKFSIPRTNIRALQFGLSKDKTLFTAIDSPSRWDTRDGSWTHSGSVYSAQGSATLAQKLDLPENVRFNFNLAWKETPNFAFRFCAENDSPTTKQDTYELTFNSAGMQIRRYENSTQPGAPIANISEIKPRLIPDQSIEVELRVNRSDGLVSLYLNRKLMGTWPDPFKTSKGNYVIINNRSSSKSSCTISNFKVSSLSDGTLPRHREKETLVPTDVLIDSDGNKRSGKLLSISEGDTNKRTVILNDKYSKTPIRVPDRRISSLLFAEPEDQPTFQKSTFTAVLDGGGRLQLENPKLVNGKLTSIHPILGPCTLSPKALSYITQVGADTPSK